MQMHAVDHTESQENKKNSSSKMLHPMEFNPGPVTFRCAFYCLFSYLLEVSDIQIIINALLIIRLGEIVGIYRA